MFEQTFVDGGKTRKTWTVMVSFLAQIVVIVVAILIPMIYFDALPKSQLSSFQSRKSHSAPVRRRTLDAAQSRPQGSGHD